MLISYLQRRCPLAAGGGTRTRRHVAGRLIERKSQPAVILHNVELGLLIKTRIAILVSGRGSNMQRLVQTCEQHLHSVEIVLVASNKPCAGIDFAAARGLPTAIIDPQTHNSRQAQETALAKTIETAAVDWIFLAGYMAVLSADFVGRFAGRILNVHPSLLPAFKGLDTHQRRLMPGCHSTVRPYILSPALDDGPVILQAGLKINEDETANIGGARSPVGALPSSFVLASIATGKLTLSNAVPHWKEHRIFATVDAVTRDFLEDHAIWPG